MRATSLAPIVLCAALLVPAGARADFADLPDMAKARALRMVEACTAAGGRPTDPMRAIERVDLDADGTPDVVLDENRFDCRDRPSLHCDPIGCETVVFLSHGGRWKLGFDVIGSYCIERDRDPARFVTIQRNFIADGRVTIINVRYRFRNGLYYQDGQGSC